MISCGNIRGFYFVLNLAFEIFIRSIITTGSGHGFSYFSNHLALGVLMTFNVVISDYNIIPLFQTETLRRKLDQYSGNMNRFELLSMSRLFHNVYLILTLVCITKITKTC